MKVIFGGETKRIPEIQKFEELVQYAATIFNADKLQAKGNDLKLFYQDDEGDIISVTCQSDLEEAYRVMTGRIKLVFSLDEEQARQSLVKGQPQPTYQNDNSFYRSEYIRPNQPQSILDRSSISQINSDFGPRPMNSQNMMGFMFEAFLQNQIECAMRQRGMSGNSNLFDNGQQPNLHTLPVEGGTLVNETPIQAIEENREENLTNDVSEQHIEEIVKELDEVQESSSAVIHSQEQVIEEPIETVDTRDMKPTASKKTCACPVGDLCFKCILNKVFSLEPFFDSLEPEPYMATCLYQPSDFTGVAGADFSATCTFKNSGNIAWPMNVQLKLVNGTIVVYNALGLENQCVQPQEELNVTIDLKLPTTPGKYILNFRLVHGDDQEFGDEVKVNLQALAKPPEAEVCRNYQPLDHKLLTRLEQPLNETDGDTFYVDQPDHEVDVSVDSIDEDNDIQNDNPRATQWIMVQDDYDTSAAPPGAKGTEDENEDGSSISPTSREKSDNPLTPISEKEVQRNFYNQQVYTERYDETYKDNLYAMMKAGYLSFDRNLQALLRTGNKFDPAVSEVSDNIE